MAYDGRSEGLLHLVKKKVERIMIQNYVISFDTSENIKETFMKYRDTSFWDETTPRLFLTFYSEFFRMADFLAEHHI